MLSSFVALGCSADPESADAPRANTLAADVQSLARDLGPGSTGQDVRTVHDYLTQFGYFPNPDLESRYPRWRAIIGAAPSRADVFDELTTEAVKAFQRQTGLPVTGVVDAPTRERLRTPRCGVPDGIPDQDPSEKFSIISGNLPAASTWRFVGNTDDGLSIANLRNTFSAMFSKWSAETNRTFTETAAAETIEIRFKAVDGPGLILAHADSTPDGTDDIVFDTNENWANGLPNGSQFDIQTIALHEMGHIMGLGHSGRLEATMFPINFGIADTTLHSDDKVAASYKFDGWAARPGTATDIGVSGSPSVASTWMISTTPTSGGFTIHQWNGSSAWIQALGGALRIAVSAVSFPWIVNNLNQIFRGTTTGAATTTWTHVPGCATDIAVGNTTWAVGCDGNVWQLNSSNVWEQRTTIGGVTRIAVDRLNVPWFIRSNGDIFTIRSGAPFQLPGCGLDIGAWNNVWITGCSSVNGGRTIHLWNEQNEVLNYVTDGNGDQIPCNFGGVPGECPSGTSCDRAVNRCFRSEAAPRRFQWLTKSGGAVTIGVGATGPWLVNSAGKIFQQDKPGTPN